MTEDRTWRRSGPSGGPGFVWRQPPKALESWTIGRLLDTAAGYLKEKGSPSARLDAELLLADTLHLERIDLYTQHDRPLTSQEVASYRALVARRAAHEPVAYIRGRACFRHLSLGVRPGVLIPRPETEELVDLALDTLRRRPAWEDLPEDAEAVAACAAEAQAAEVQTTPDGAARAGPATPDGAAPAAPAPVAGLSAAAETAAAKRPGSRGPARSSLPAIADVGTGSGAIALSLAQEAAVRVLALDASAEALAVAGENAEAVGLGGWVAFRQGDLLAGIPDRSLALVVSNPPYVRSGDIPALAPDIRRFEPTAALDGGPDGLDVYRRLVPHAARALRPGGTLLVEVGEEQAGAVCALARTAGFALAAVHKDLSRKDRLVEATLPGAPMRTPEELAPAEIRALRTALGAGAVIGVPTDTVYGIAARWDVAAGIRRLFAAKQRSPEQPVAVLFPSVEAVKVALPDLEPVAARVIAALLPGPYTLVVATAVSRPALVGTPDSLGVRVPDHPDLLGLLAALNVPLAATSANRSGRPEPAAADQVDPVVLAHCSLAVIAGGHSPVGTVGAGGETAGTAKVAGVASTVVDLRPLAAGEAPVILREGAVSGQEVLSRIGACL